MVENITIQGKKTHTIYYAGRSVNRARRVMKRARRKEILIITGEMEV